MFAKRTTDEQGGISLSAWAFGVVRFCLLTESGLLDLLFSMLRYAPGTFAKPIALEGALTDLATDLHAANQAFFQTIKPALDEITANQIAKTQCISRDEFGLVHRKNRMILYPAFILQGKLRARTLGVRKWAQLARKLPAEIKVRRLVTMNSSAKVAPSSAAA